MQIIDTNLWALCSLIVELHQNIRVTFVLNIELNIDIELNVDIIEHNIDIIELNIDSEPNIDIIELNIDIIELNLDIDAVGRGVRAPMCFNNSVKNSHHHSPPDSLTRAGHVT